jgi:hypothetical protein
MKGHWEQTWQKNMGDILTLGWFHGIKKHCLFLKENLGKRGVPELGILR